MSLFCHSLEGLSPFEHLSIREKVELLRVSGWKVWEHLRKVVLLSDRRASEHPGEGLSPFEPVLRMAKGRAPSSFGGSGGLWVHFFGCFIKYRLCTSIMSFTSSPSRYFLIRSAGIQSSLSTFCRALVHS